MPTNDELKQSLLLKALFPQQTPEDPNLAAKRKQRDSLYQSIQGNESPGLTSKEDIALGVIQGLSTIASFGLGGTAGGMYAAENAPKQFGAIRQEIESNRQNTIQNKLGLASQIDRDIKTDRSYTNNSSDSALGAVRQLNVMDQLARQEKSDENLNKYRQDSLALREKELEARREALALKKSGGGTPGKDALTTKTLEEAKVWKPLIETINSEKSRSALGQIKLRQVQGEFVKRVFDSVPPSGVSPDQWRAALAKNPKMLDAEPSQDRIRRFNNMPPFQKYEAVAGYIRQITGGEPTDINIKQAFPHTVGESASKIAQAMSSWRNKRNFGTGDGSIMETIFQGVKAENDLARQMHREMIGVPLRRLKPWIEADPERKAIADDMINNPEKYLESDYAPGQKPSSQMTEEEIDAELKAHGVQ